MVHCIGSVTPNSGQMLSELLGHDGAHSVKLQCACIFMRNIHTYRDATKVPKLSTKSTRIFCGAAIFITHFLLRRLHVYHQHYIIIIIIIIIIIYI